MGPHRGPPEAKRSAFAGLFCWGLAEMNNEKLIQRLRALEKRRGDINAFSSHDEFMHWADQVHPLLGFNSKLQSQFDRNVYLTDKAFTLGANHNSYLHEAIGIVTRALGSIEVQNEASSDEYSPKLPDQSEEQQAAETACHALERPSTITLRWVIDHMSWSAWMVLLGALATAFLLGVAFTKTPLYERQLTCPSHCVKPGAFGVTPFDGVDIREFGEAMRGGSGDQPPMGDTQDNLILRAPALNLIGEPDPAKSLDISLKHKASNEGDSSQPPSED